MMKRRYWILAVVVISAITLLSSCNRRKSHELKATKADSILFNVGVFKEYDRMIAIADSFEMTGDLTPLDANRWRGVAYYHQGQYLYLAITSVKNKKTYIGKLDFPVPHLYIQYA
jgi:hypothetical protein